MAENNLPALKNALNTEGVQKKFQELLGKKSAGFITSITTVVQNNDLLKKADVNSIILAAAQAASLDLPINPNLGFASIIPFNDKKSGTCVAQFQIQRDGWVDLCLRTGQFEYISNEIVYEGELVEKNRFTDTYVFDETKRTSDKVIGYMASFKLVNGYKKTVYWTVEECKMHGLQYSQTFKKGYGLWKDNFNAMSLKTVLKHLLKKFAPKSIESISQAIESDQASFIGDLNNSQVVYVDNQKDDKEHVEVTEFEEVIEESKEQRDLGKEAEDSNQTSDLDDMDF
jgi:recombination protein RecT